MNFSHILLHFTKVTLTELNNFLKSDSDHVSLQGPTACATAQLHAPTILLSVVLETDKNRLCVRVCGRQLHLVRAKFSEIWPTVPKV
jgi:hypothetical protein